MSHTPGPWAAVQVYGWSGKEDEGFRVTHTPGRQCILWCSGNDHDGRDAVTSRADAHLLAAAPELLELARGYYEYLKDHGRLENGIVEPFVGEKIKAIIAKAEGKEEGKA